MWKRLRRGLGKKLHWKLVLLLLPFAIFVGGYGGYFTYYKINPVTINSSNTIIKTKEGKLVFDDSFVESEKQLILGAIKSENIKLDGLVQAKVRTSLVHDSKLLDINGYLAVVNGNTARQQVTKVELASLPIKIWKDISSVEQTAIATSLGSAKENHSILSSLDELKNEEIALIPISEISPMVKLLSIDGSYYLDDFTSGAIFRQVEFSGPSSSTLAKLVLSDLPSRQSVLSINQTGVTALTRVMQKRLNEVNNPLYFSKLIGGFLRSSDITHVSNEVSFKENCAYSTTAFCSDPRFIETLKDSGVDIVELTGNHNNDLGREYNKNTIELYRSLGWHTVGGGLNTNDAAKFYLVDQKQSKIAFLAYNFADSPGSGAIALDNLAGANSFDTDKIKQDIEKAKLQSNFIIIDVQFWECYAYPSSYVEYPVCDKPIGQQEATFKNLIDLGADMVVGTQAHQPQIFERYKGKPIYYGLGNLYFDQTQWPGTERGIILTHYFLAGKLLQTKLTPTIYDKTLQTRLMSDKNAVDFLSRLINAR